MKKILFAFLVGCLPLVAVQAASGDNCTVDISASVPAGQDWSQVYFIHAPDGSVWQRAPIANHDSLKLEERQPVRILGTADAGKEVVVFVFSPADNGQGGIKKPGTGTCFSAGQADRESQFVLNFNSKLLWGKLGEKVMIDAFYKVDSDWGKHVKEMGRESQNFFIGTHSFPTELQVNAAGEPGNCIVTCKESGMVQATKLDPVVLDPKLLGNNFDKVGGNTVDIGRMPGEHTFYGSSQAGNNAAQRDELRTLSMKSLTMEYIKRLLLANPSAAPTFAPGLDQLSAATLREAAAGKTGSKDVQQLARMIRTIMTGLPYAGPLDLKTSGRGQDPIWKEPSPTPINANQMPLERTRSIELPSLTAPGGLPVNIPNALPAEDSEEDDLNAPQAVQDLGGQPPTGSTRQPPKQSNGSSKGGGGTPAKKKSGGNSGAKKSNGGGGGGSGPGGAAPAKSTPKPPGREEVMQKFGPLTNLGGVPNLPQELFPPSASTDSTWAEDFIKMTEFWTGNLEVNGCLAKDDPLFKQGFLKENFDVNSNYVCQYIYTQGLTPTLVLSIPEAVTLEPAFAGATMAIAQKPFDQGETWILAAGDKKPLSYRYELTEPLTPSYQADFCVDKVSAGKVATALSKPYGLNDAESQAITDELLTEMPKETGYYRVRLADPQQIASRFVWKGNGESLDLLQLFFKVVPGGCDAPATELPLSPVVDADRDGFEAGILK